MRSDLNLSSIRRILVTRFRFMGDVILTTPVISSLKEALPQAEISYLVEPPYDALLQHNPDIHGIIPFQRHRYDHCNWVTSLRLQWQLVQRLREKRFDLAIDLFGIPRSAWFVFFTGAPIRIGGKFRYRHHLYTHTFDTETGWQTAIEFHYLALKTLGLGQINQIVRSQPKVYLTSKEIDWAENFLKTHKLNKKKFLIGLHPGGTWPAKLWPEHYYAELAKRLHREFDTQVIFTHGPKEKEIVRRLKEKVEEAAFFVPLLSLRQLAALLQQCDLYISNDCGPMHLAVAVGTPTFGIFGPSEPDIWFPYDPRQGHRAIYKPIACRPCHLHQCPRLHQCMTEVSVSDVLKHVENVLPRAS
ncbi:lipopolysaccharide heptosyltransferase II [candidate division KSB1 bacterium]|nr:MAG: lipopolysaccharide heptosyltransferase II [candidate division KSB1 bacterium]